MLVVDPEKRFTINQCLSHPWMTAGVPDVNDSTDGLVGGLAGLEVHRRGVHRQRTLLSSINTIEMTKIPGGTNHDAIKVFSKNTRVLHQGAKEPRPGDNRTPDDFAELGGKGDPELFGNETSVYSKNDIAGAKKNNMKNGR